MKPGLSGSSAGWNSGNIPHGKSLPGAWCIPWCVPGSMLYPLEGISVAAGGTVQVRRDEVDGQARGCSLRDELGHELGLHCGH